MLYNLLNKYLTEGGEGSSIADTLKTTLPVLDDMAILAYQKYKNERKDKKKPKTLKGGGTNEGTGK